MSTNFSLEKPGPRTDAETSSILRQLHIDPWGGSHQKRLVEKSMPGLFHKDIMLQERIGEGMSSPTSFEAFRMRSVGKSMLGEGPRVPKSIPAILMDS
ncbi:hypothetical protein E4U54_005457, partial [Claviceps lovelessii]